VNVVLVLSPAETRQCCFGMLPTDMCAYTLNEPSFKVLCAVLFLQPFDSIVTCYCSSAVLPSVNTELHIFYEILVSQISC
jgi:hypothetical protein